MNPGAAKSTKKLKDIALLLDIQGGKCLLCDQIAKASECNLDHLWPTAHALVASHVECNSLKGNSEPTEEQKNRYYKIEEKVIEDYSRWRRLFTLIKRTKR